MTPRDVVRPRVSKVVVRDLGTNGVKHVNHTSFRLGLDDRELLRRVAGVKYGGINMSAVLRILIRDEAVRLGLIDPSTLTAKEVDE